jgi:hypothetical protein
LTQNHEANPTLSVSPLPKWPKWVPNHQLPYSKYESFMISPPQVGLHISDNTFQLPPW